MIKLTLATTAKRETVIVDVNSTPASVLDDHSVSTTGATVSLNMKLLGNSDLDKSFTDLGIAEDSEAMLSAVVKADAAM